MPYRNQSVVRFAIDAVFHFFPRSVLQHDRFPCVHKSVRPLAAYTLDEKQVVFVACRGVRVPSRIVRDSVIVVRACWCFHTFGWRETVHIGEIRKYRLHSVKIKSALSLEILRYRTRMPLSNSASTSHSYVITFLIVILIAFGLFVLLRPSSLCYDDDEPAPDVWVTEMFGNDSSSCITSVYEQSGNENTATPRRAWFRQRSSTNSNQVPDKQLLKKYLPIRVPYKNRTMFQQLMNAPYPVPEENLRTTTETMSQTVATANSLEFLIVSMNDRVRTVIRIAGEQQNHLFDHRNARLNVIANIATVLYNIYRSLCNQHFSQTLEFLNSRTSIDTVKLAVTHAVNKYLVPFLNYLSNAIHHLNDNFNTSLNTSIDDPADNVIELERLDTKLRAKISARVQQQLTGLTTDRLFDRIQVHINHQTREIVGNIHAANYPTRAFINAIAYNTYCCIMMQVGVDLMKFSVESAFQLTRTPGNIDEGTKLSMYDTVNVCFLTYLYMSSMCSVFRRNIKPVPKTPTQPNKGQDVPQSLSISSFLSQMSRSDTKQRKLLPFPTVDLVVTVPSTTETFRCDYDDEKEINRHRSLIGDSMNDALSRRKYEARCTLTGKRYGVPIFVEENSPLIRQVTDDGDDDNDLYTTLETFSNHTSSNTYIPALDQPRPILQPPGGMLSNDPRGGVDVDISKGPIITHMATKVVT